MNDRRKAVPNTEDGHKSDMNDARIWVRKAVQEFFDANRDRPYTVAEILGSLDEHPDAPDSWTKWLDGAFYQMRYALVRNACQLWLSRGLLETETTINARGREGVICYRRSPDARWFVEVAGDDADVPRITESALKWARGNPRLLKGASSVLLTRRPTKSYDTRTNASEEKPRRRRNS